MAGGIKTAARICATCNKDLLPVGTTVGCPDCECDGVSCVNELITMANGVGDEMMISPSGATTDDSTKQPTLSRRRALWLPQQTPLCARYMPTYEKAELDAAAVCS